MRSPVNDNPREFSAFRQTRENRIQRADARLDSISLLRANDAEKMVDKYRDDTVVKLNAKIMSEGKITLDHNPGREFVPEVSEKPGHEAVIKWRAFFVRNQLYQVTVVGPQEELTATEVMDFFDSFRLTTK